MGVLTVHLGESGRALGFGSGGAEGDVYIAVSRLCVFHKLLAFPVTGGGSNIGVIELSWHHSELAVPCLA